MKKLLIVLLLSAFSPIANAAESIVHDDKKGIFIEEKEANKLMQIIDVELPSLKKQVELLKKENKIQTEITTLTKMELNTETQISGKWKSVAESNAKELAKKNIKDRVLVYISIGFFVSGTATGAAIMYIASRLLNNIR